MVTQVDGSAVGGWTDGRAARHARITHGFAR